MSNQWREEQNRCQREIEQHQEANKSYMDEGVQLLELARNAQLLFAKQDPRKTPLAELRVIELHLGGWRSGSPLSATFSSVGVNHHDRRPRCCGRDGQIDEK